MAVLAWGSVGGKEWWCFSRSTWNIRVLSLLIDHQSDTGIAAVTHSLGLGDLFKFLSFSVRIGEPRSSLGVYFGGW